MEEQVFADGIGTISVIGGTVRIDFVAYSPTEKDHSGQPIAVFRQRIIMGMDAFMHSAGKIHEAAQTLESRRHEPVQVSIVPDIPIPQEPAPHPVEPAPQPTPPPAVKPPFP